MCVPYHSCVKSPDSDANKHLCRYCKSRCPVPAFIFPVRPGHSITYNPYPSECFKLVYQSLSSWGARMHAVHSHLYRLLSYPFDRTHPYSLPSLMPAHLQQSCTYKYLARLPGYPCTHAYQVLTHSRMHQKYKYAVSHSKLFTSTATAKYFVTCSSVYSVKFALGFFVEIDQSVTWSDLNFDP